LKPPRCHTTAINGETDLLRSAKDGGPFAPDSTHTKRLGIVGGIAPASTVDYYRQLTSRYRSRSPDGSYPTILIDSIDGQRFLQLVRGGDRQALVRYLQGEVARLARAGADVALLASNTPHLVFDHVAAEAPIPLISIVEEAAKSAEMHGWKKLGLLGARITMDGGFYEPVFARRGIAVVTPPGEDRAFVDGVYFRELTEGVFRDETRAAVEAVIERMAARDRIDAAILGGTELPLLLRDSDGTSVPMLDTTAIHVESAVSWLLSH
jgi:aspartate racemase